ncbi:MAG: homoaconitase [Stygiobacter sp. RIFOXYC12_FULL_38_8]|nr:MAG: homoaconitase [Stygiobacter sp. GWC2_38_9]OGV06933.1 MAG: homoaconitase [Stygiobacter sp. RIFOXYB2_FULL_37_11]OGV11482.1 MAG: homoaconitase [Stygiobacter sp. RIFOXYA2_FULL_38_8]OGV14080.1 MAG: homoaconitase [Stygiobacter sp. RIFOXYC2_FULL_38_25]OGV25931.1 MAG: homoaconitase [Stygiobacter sp. RIFOXYC12_FULL_38_8]OGV82584.1 MAG: homoaconitase [Stygiobacter sp. GWF2_38_21]OGV99809.1 MAG: homoaconitase [Melioribacter sp. RIFOXYB12_FULL_38_5]RJQ63092.1 MAG: homoaconitase [Stygiobacter sp.
MKQTLVEKIVQKFSVGLSADKIVRSGDYVTIRPAYVMTHDNTGAVIPKFKSIGATKLSDSKQVVITLDHDIQNKSEKNLEKYKKIEEFAKLHGADFYPAGRGIGHQVMVEEGYTFPGTFVVASDSHSNMYGGIGCLGTPIVRTDAASIWATGKTWWQVPPIAKVELKGELRKGVTGKDVIIALCGLFNKDEVLNHAIEFVGEGIKHLSIDQRLTIANMTTEWGALVGLFPIDEVTIEWMKTRNEKLRTKNENIEHSRINIQTISELEIQLDQLRADDDAFYAKEISVDISSISPFVSGPNTVKKMSPVSELQHQKIKIDKAYLVSCVNSRVDDIAEAASIAKGKKFSEHVQFYIGAASSEVQAESEQRGDWQTLIDSGAIPLSPGCGPCIGLGIGLLEDGEVGISATNRNFKGRMGSPNAQAYLASPAVVASSAINGFISSEWEGTPEQVIYTIKNNVKTEQQSTKVKILNGFPSQLQGELIFCHQDNLNTDGIYPGKYTYNDDITPAEQAKVVMENYDPEFGSIVNEGNILVGGYNFGTGSSREQAATALKYRGIKLVIAGSFNETYKRNALNNGLLVIECPGLANDLKSRFGLERLTVNTKIETKINFVTSTIEAGDIVYSIVTIGEAAQELIIAGGLENWIKKNIL